MELQTYARGERLVVGDRLMEITKEARTRWGSLTYQAVEVGGTERQWLTPRRLDRPSPVIDRKAIRVMVERFYEKVGGDPALGPVFEVRIHGDWEPHLSKMVLFWSAVLLREFEYDGSPPTVHRAIGELAPEHFGRWLELLELTLAENFEEGPARNILARAQGMARGLSSTVLGQPWNADW